MSSDTTPAWGSPDEDGSETAHELGSLTGYESVTYLGRGGTASLYTARRSSDNETVVLKTFDRDQAHAAERQWSIARRLDGIPGVLPVSDRTVLDDGRHVVTMPYVAGGSLGDHMTRFGPMSTDAVIDIGVGLATALQASHEAGILHRDLKPSNVLLAGDGEAMLCDFDAATEIDVDTATETMAITVLYAAPEVLEGAPADATSDVYSLGLTLWSAAVGSPPFGGPKLGGLASLVNQVCTVGPADPATMGVPEGLASVLRRATSLDPADRYSSAGELADALRSARSGSAEPSGGGSAPRETAPTAPHGATTATVSAGGSSGDGPEARGAARIGVPLVAAAVVIAVAIALVLAGRDRGGPERILAAGGTSVTTSVTGGSALGLADRDVDGPGATPEPSTEELVQATTPDGVLGPLFQIDDFTYQGRLSRECKRDERWVAFSIHADQDDRKAGIEEPWRAVKGEQAGTFMAYLPCENGGLDIRYVLRAPGRWFVVVAMFPQDQYDRMVEWMRENETSPAPDYTVDDEIRATLGDPANYLASAVIDRSE